MIEASLKKEPKSNVIMLECAESFILEQKRVNNDEKLNSGKCRESAKQTENKQLISMNIKSKKKTLAVRLKTVKKMILCKVMLRI